MVIWLIGLSSAGKTVIGRELCSLLKKKRPNVVFFDGDILREILGTDLGYTLKDREVNAWRACRLCQYLDSQGIDVVFSILSIFPKTREWNRKNIEKYFEIYIRVPFDTLVDRDAKGIYKRALHGEIKNVVGVDIDFPEPTNPDLIIDNDKGEESIKEIAKKIVESIPWEKD